MGPIIKGQEGTICCPETSVTINIRCVTPEKSEYLIYAAVEA
jgi:hypothetical protein